MTAVVSEAKAKRTEQSKIAQAGNNQRGKLMKALSLLLLCNFECAARIKEFVGDQA